MLEKIREGSQGVIAKSILVLVILSFAFTGVSSYLGSSTEAVAATVNGEEIRESALEQAYQNERARLEQQLGDMFEALAADDVYLASVKQSVLERLVAEKLLDQTATELGLRVSDQQIKNAIMTEPAFQTDGLFDNARYLTILSQLGYQTNTFRNVMRTDMTRRQFVASLVGSEFALPGETRYLADIQEQTRDIRYHIVDASPFVADAKVTDEQAQSFYDTNLVQFMSPETLSLEYIELNAADMANDVSVTDEEAQVYYDENKQQYLIAEKRLAAHILINLGDDESVSKAKAEAIYVRLQAGEDFAELAKTESEDTFSGELGGQLDWFEQGVMEPAFDEVLYSLSQGSYSTVVKTNSAFHIIKLVDLQPGSEVPIADVKDEIIAQLKDMKAVDMYFSLQQTLADVTYEVPDTLSEAASALGVAVKTTSVFTRANAPAPFDKPDVLKAAFSTNVLLDGMNSDVIEVDVNHAMVIRLKSHSAAGTVDFTKVKANIIERLKQQQANEVAREKAQGLMTAFNNAQLSTEFVTKIELGRFEQGIDAAISSKAFQMAHPADIAVVDTVALANGYAVIVLDKVNAAEGIDNNLLDALEQRLSSQYSEGDYKALIATLKAKSDVVYSLAQ
ncbi:MAG: SurA N-terminal domain-containing protein [Shewanella sp.]